MTPPSPPRTLPLAALSIALALGLLPAVLFGASPPANQLTLEETPGVFTVYYTGKSGYIGIPSWKAVVRQDDAGNITALHVPADHPVPLSSRTGQWPISIIMSKNTSGIEGTMTKGRENFARFPVETFKLVEHSPEKIIIATGGPSKNRHYEHHRTYTFTPAGIQIEGSLLPLIDLSSIAFDPHFNLTQIADSHHAMLPLRTQGRGGWTYMASSGRDGATALPEGADFPLEAQLKLRRGTPTVLKIFYDKNFESASGKRVLIHNNKDGWEAKADKIIYEKLVGIAGFPVPKGAEQTFKVRFEFETQPLE